MGRAEKQVKKKEGRADPIGPQKPPRVRNLCAKSSVGVFIGPMTLPLPWSPVFGYLLTGAIVH